MLPVMALLLITVPPLCIPMRDAAVAAEDSLLPPVLPAIELALIDRPAGQQEDAVAARAAIAGGAVDAAAIAAPTRPCTVR